MFLQKQKISKKAHEKENNRSGTKISYHVALKNI